MNLFVRFLIALASSGQTSKKRPRKEKENGGQAREPPTKYLKTANHTRHPTSTNLHKQNTSNSAMTVKLRLSTHSSTQKGRPEQTLASRKFPITTPSIPATKVQSVNSTDTQTPARLQLPTKTRDRPQTEKLQLRQARENTVDQEELELDIGIEDALEDCSKDSKDEVSVTSNDRPYVSNFVWD